MRRLYIVALVALAALGLTACEDDTPLADRIVGQYNCSSTAYTYHMKDTIIEGRTIPLGWEADNTTPTVTRNEVVTISRLGDELVGVQTTSRHWGTGTFDSVSLHSYSSTINLLGEGSLVSSGSSYPSAAELSGTFDPDGKSFTLTVITQTSTRRTALAFEK